MPQELHVLRCYSCRTFQVHIVKKSNKWECKMCGEKQSVKKVYGRGSGKDCRLHVQRLNEMSMNQEALGDQISPFNCNEDPFLEEKARHNAGESHFLSSHRSKWSRFLDEQDLEETGNAVACHSAVSASQLITETVRNAYKTEAKEESEIKQTFNSPEQEALSYDSSRKVFHTNVDTTCIHQNTGLKNMEHYFLLDEEIEPHELSDRQYIGYPSLEMQQGSNTESLVRNTGSVRLPTMSTALQHAPVQWNSISTSTNSSKVLCPPPTLVVDSEDELDNILSF